VVSILRHLERRYDPLDQPGGPEALFADYRARSATLGRRVRVDLWAGSVEGTAVDITPEGHLVVEEAGQQRMVTAGDVVHVRPV
jgi:BirA family biotin operon repressor/biotin-[acetyl-CoA-carboxylase] ligase